MVTQNQRKNRDGDEEERERDEQRRGWFKNGAHNSVNCRGSPIFSSKSENAGVYAAGRVNRIATQSAQRTQKTLPISLIQPVNIGASIVSRPASMREYSSIDALSRCNFGRHALPTEYAEYAHTNIADMYMD